MKLNPYPEYKDSGVPWLGKVPVHWKIERLKSLMSNIIQQTAERQSSDLYVALEHVESWTGCLRQVGSEVLSDSQVKRFRFGDVLFGKLRPYLAKVTRPASDGVCVGEFLVLRPRVDLALHERRVGETVDLSDLSRPKVARAEGRKPVQGDS
jgi:type I restriction enzyme S subunit